MELINNNVIYYSQLTQTTCDNQEITINITKIITILYQKQLVW